MRYGNRATYGGGHENLDENLTVAGALLFSVTPGIVAGTPEQEKAFNDKHKAAMEGKDTATLEASFTHKAPTPGPSSFTK